MGNLCLSYSNPGNIASISEKLFLKVVPGSSLQSSMKTIWRQRVSPTILEKYPLHICVWSGHYYYSIYEEGEDDWITIFYIIYAALFIRTPCIQTLNKCWGNWETFKLCPHNIPGQKPTNFQLYGNIFWISPFPIFNNCCWEREEQSEIFIYKWNTSWCPFSEMKNLCLNIGVWGTE